MAENHPFLEMLTGMGFEKQKCINVMNRVGLDANIEQLVIALTSEPEPQPELNLSTEIQNKAASNQESTNQESTSQDSTKMDTSTSSLPTSDQLKSQLQQASQTTSTPTSALQAAENRAAGNAQAQLDAEERAKKNAEIDARANAARLARFEREKLEKHAKEQHRRAEGRKMMGVNNDMEDAEMKRNKRLMQEEKAAALAAKLKIKQQIEEDRAARKNNGGLIKKSKDSENSTSKSPVAPVSIKPAPDQCRIRIQFPDGTKIQNAFKSSETLAAVRCFVEEKKEVFDRNTYQYSLAYPRKIFTWEDFDKPLALLNLGGSAVIMVEKRNQQLQQATPGESEFTSSTQIPPMLVETLGDFNALIKIHKKVVVDFTASWCGPCKKIAPFFVELAEKNRQIQFVKVDVDENEETAKECAVRAMPTFHFYKDGVKVDELQGADPKKLEEKVKSL